MKIFHDVTPAGDENFKLSGYVQLSPAAQPINPSVDGFAFYITDSSQREYFHRDLAPGTQWRQSINKRLWTYSDPTAIFGDVKKVSIISIPLKGPNFYKVTVNGHKGNFMLSSTQLPAMAIFIMGGRPQADNGLCATQLFNLPTGPAPLCHTIGTILVCK